MSRLHRLVSLLSLLGEGLAASLQGLPLVEAGCSVTVVTGTMERLVCSSFLASGLGCGRSLLRGRRDRQFLLQLVALQETELDTQLQDGFLLLVNSLIQVGVLVLQVNQSQH